SAHSTLWRTFWEYKLLPHHVRSQSAGLWHGLGNLSPAASGIPFILTVHDVIYRQFPQSLPPGYRWFMRWMQPRAARRGGRVIVPSRFSADEVARLGVAPERIRQVSYGPGHGFQPIADQALLQKALDDYGVRRPFILNVCRGYYHKNLPGLVQAFARLRQR